MLLLDAAHTAPLGHATHTALQEGILMARRRMILTRLHERHGIDDVFLLGCRPHRPSLLVRQEGW